MKSQLLAFSTILLITASSIIPTPVFVSTKAKNTVVSNQSAEFSFFRTHRQQKGAVATWALTTNTGVLYFQLQRTYQDPTDPYSMWENIATIECTAERTFKYNDKEVLAGRIYYRVVAYFEGDYSITSEVSDIKIVSH
ncbi:MAG: hypothetical protein H7Y42_17270 [Chitinophagaceae bacterium]|nr:hypothetical protein [Chitinophagaceae bacterium]